jgi:hypothetical protein
MVAHALTAPPGLSVRVYSGQDVADRIITQIGKGVLDDAQVSTNVGAEQARVTVSGEASKVVPAV